MPRRISEEQTRKKMIDPQLKQAGWNMCDHSKVKIEIPVDSYDAEPWNGVSDYCLYRENGEGLAVVECKRASTDIRLAEAQLTYYVTEIEKHHSFRPFGFVSNGLKIHFVDVGIAHKRECLVSSHVNIWKTCITFGKTQSFLVPLKSITRSLTAPTNTKPFAVLAKLFPIEGCAPRWDGLSHENYNQAQ